MPDPRELLKDHILRAAHVGFVVPDLDTAVAEACRVYGLTEAEVSYVPEPGQSSPTRFAFFSLGGLEFELIEPVSDDFRERLLGMASGGGGINHVAWRVRDIAGAVALLASQGIHPGHVTPDGIVRIGEKKMVYLDPETTGGLVIELIQYPGDD